MRLELSCRTAMLCSICDREINGEGLDFLVKIHQSGMSGIEFVAATAILMMVCPVCGGSIHKSTRISIANKALDFFNKGGME